MAKSRVCSIPDCGKPERARGWCMAHYARHRKNGAPKITRSGCVVDGCGRKHFGQGYCSMHWRRLQRHGTLERVRASANDHRAVIDAALTADTDECILWPFGAAENTYSYISFPGYDVLAHRYVCEQKHGPCPPDKLDAAHSCGRKRCINYRHLRWATRSENAHDMIVHETRSWGEKHGLAKLTDALAREIKYAQGNHTQVAKRFGVRRETARDIRNGRRWRHI